MSFANKVYKFIQDNKLFDKNELILVALSGGADSVALLCVLEELGYRIEAIHCNFKLRGKEADRDEAFCKQLCEANNIVLHLTHFDTYEFAKLRKISIEMAARQLRYTYFEQIRKMRNAQTICVGHHIEDSVETFLINLVRGTGINGLKGISCRKGYISRPLLTVNREEIESYLSEKGIGYITDSSNLIADVVRNKIRLNVIPLLKDINPSVNMSIIKTAERITEANRIVEKELHSAIERVSIIVNKTLKINIQSLLEETSPEMVLHKLLYNQDIPSDMIEQVFYNLTTCISGKHWKINNKIILIDRGFILIREENTKSKDMIVPEPGYYVYSEQVKFKIDTGKIDATFTINKNKEVATLDLNKVNFPLNIRHIVSGDRFSPYGMTGTKLVSDYLTDRKKNFFEKEDQLVITDVRGKIVWLVEERIDNHYCITSKSSSALFIHVIH